LERKNFEILKHDKISFPSYIFALKVEKKFTKIIIQNKVTSYDQKHQVNLLSDNSS